MVVTHPGMKPCSLRVDQLDRDTDESIKKNCKSSEHFGNEGNPKHESVNCNDNSAEEVKDFETPKSELNVKAPAENIYPEIVHFGIRPPQLSYAGNPE